ncbi:MAG: InlB B-repeat-containing protein [Dysgonamonadaceae bacterium]|jgi:uncharacterized repeat protein (TIGR02543 family)|nr:InlB B-repeat-containing protein [Dysgonamonadaceae bacterium]
MKKITLLLMACCMSVMTFAAGGNITYVLNGGVTNPDGWTSKADMLVGFNQDYNTANSVASSATWYTWETLDVILAAGDPVVRIPTFAAAGFYPVLTAAKWQWLHDYIVATGVAQSIAAIAEADNAFWRYEVSAFFVNGKRAAWPISADYTVAGQPSAFIPAWKQAFAGPATYDGSADVTIPDPYKEGSTFDGWYATADFSGAKVTSIPAGSDGDKTLYAKWVDYVPTCAEVKALAAGTTTKASGVVTYVNGTAVYLQDASAGLLIEFAAVPSVAAGDKITLSGTTAAVGAYVKLTGATLSEKEAATLPAFQTINLATLLADAAPYMFEYLYLEGLTITAYGSGTVTLSDDANNAITLVATLSQTTFPVGTKVNLKATVSYDTKVLLVGYPENVVAALVSIPDPATYPAQGNGKYTLTNKWLIANTLDNFTANRLGIADHVRGMAAKDGKMYFPDRNLKQLVVVDGATGARLAPIPLASNIFRFINASGAEQDAGTLPFNDIKVDAAGHILLGNCITSNAQPFQVWKINLADGTGTLIVSEILLDNPDFAQSTIRFDAFGVYGDVDNDAIIMAANASAMEAYKFTIRGGVLESVEVVIIDVSEAGTFLTGLANPGTAPQIFPMDENYFYLDGFSTLPTLIDMEGNVVDGFYNVPVEVEDWETGNGNKKGHNGLAEFELGGEYFFIMASMNTAGTPPSAFRLFKWKDANKEFKDIESLWTLPAAGMGSATNGYRTAVPSVEVNEATKTATIYLYTGENGYGVYEFKIGASAINPVNKDAVSVIASGNQVRLSEKAAGIKVFNLVGQLVQKAQGVSSITIPNRGMYIVSVQTLKGEIITKKVIIK